MINRPVLDGESLITPTAMAADVVSRYGPSRRDQFATATAELGLILHTAQQWFEGGTDPVQTMRWTVEALHKTRRKLDPAVWRELIPIAQNHPVAAFFHEDPFTRWSFEKNRGYSGDAQLLDFIYQHESILGSATSATPIGRELYAFSKYYPSCVAVRERRDILAQKVDEIADAKGPGTEVLAIAAGHLREAEKSAALRNGRITRWVALDQDPLSVGSVTRDFAGTAVEAIDGSVRGLLTDAHKLGRFDFIYAAGLYDYLTDAVAIRLSRRCMRMLKPNGVLFFANFSPELTDDGYMETFMDWTLLLRSEADMWKIVNGSVDRNSVDADVFFGENRNIVYATIAKRD
ncbi:class I SAM-dependent methyltransferase [Mesorhizobium sp. L-8-3]|uniref:class I SAM-dependent methyltransferase n=1 Tax=Mesorhizobium sp. L-8-3 TaxID=2744522 RepID=UPI0019252C1D|nr:class I SAM-dependent methyltransferase [Mesorhizobium sp. L-8-3]